MSAQQKGLRQLTLFYPKKHPTSMDLVRDLPKCLHKHLLRNKYPMLASEFHPIGDDCVMLYHLDFME